MTPLHIQAIVMISMAAILGIGLIIMACIAQKPKCDVGSNDSQWIE